jgi:hypothetical protein
VTASSKKFEQNDQTYPTTHTQTANNKNMENNRYSTQGNHQNNIGPLAITSGTPTVQNCK